MAEDWKPPKLPFTPDTDRIKQRLRAASSTVVAASKRSAAATRQGFRATAPARKSAGNAFRGIFTRKRMATMGGLIGAFLLIVPFATYAYYARDIGDRERLMNRKDTGIILKDRTGQIIYKQGTISSGDDVTLGQVSDNLKNALIASEDKSFYTHDGFSPRGIVRSLYANIIDKNATQYGGSTITQQLVKNKLFSSNKSYVRKYQELSMAIAVERKYTKQQILEMYLNSVYFGEGAFGINDAARTYFGKSPADLSVAESAMLVGVLPAPSAYSPLSGNARLAKQEQARVLREMVETGAITKAQMAAAEKQPLSYATASPRRFERAQHFAMMVLDELKQKYGDERVSRSGFVVTTTLDLAKQTQAEEIIQRQVARFSAGGGRNASLVAIDPRTGQVEALVGSVDWNNPQFGKVNMATALRQPGSSFKPIFYAEALNRRLITAATILQDKPTDFGGWKPENFDFKFKGDMPVRNALAESRNIPAAEVMQKLGTDQAVATAQRMGISSVNDPGRYGLTLAVGTAEVRLYDMVNAYAAFADQGIQYTPVTYTQIRDKYGKVVYQQGASKAGESSSQPQGTNQPEGAPQTPGTAKRVQSEQASYIISSILSDEQARAPTYGSSLNIPGRQVALKTGTTDESRDAWTIGYTPSLALGIWVGNNEHEPMRGLAGGSSAGLIWREAMADFLEGTPVERFTPPAGVRTATACAGGRAYTEVFIEGTDAGSSCNRNIAGDDGRAVADRVSKAAEKALKEAQKQAAEQAAQLQDQLREQQAARQQQLDQQQGGRGGGSTEGGPPPESPPGSGGNGGGGTTPSPPPDGQAAPDQ